MRPSCRLISTLHMRGSNSDAVRWRASPPRASLVSGFGACDFTRPMDAFRSTSPPGAASSSRLREGWTLDDPEDLAEIERIPLEAPRADALKLELLSFIHAVRGEREAVVRGEEGRAAVALALEVSAAVARNARTLAVP